MAADPDRKRGARTSSPAASVDAFLCAHCGHAVSPESYGTRQRNHCPHCLHSLHVDLAVGDRRSLCRGLMAPLAAAVRQGGELVIVHRCLRCGTLRLNRVAGDDDFSRLMALAAEVQAALAEPAGVSEAHPPGPPARRQRRHPR